MTQSDVCATDFEPFDVTTERRQRFENTVAEVLEGLAESWREDGDDPDSPEGQAALANARHYMLVPGRTEWMPPARAVGVFANDSGPSLDLHDAMRTRWSMTDKEWAGVVGRMMGISAERVLSTYKPRDPVLEARHQARMKARTMLYRHYDADGLLLYVGITANLHHRNKLHAIMSPWWEYVADTTTEWFPNRTVASEAEQTAVVDEAPVFNDKYDRRNDGDRRRAEYLNGR